MAEHELTDSEAGALSGTIVGPGCRMPTTHEEDWHLSNNRAHNRSARALIPLTGCEVYKDDAGDLKFGVRAGDFMDGATVREYAGASNQSLTDENTNYIYLTAAGTLTVNTTGFPAAGTTPHIPLAEIVCAGGTFSYDDIDASCRSRAILNVLSAMTPANANTLVGGGNADALHTHGESGLDANAVSVAKLAAAVQDLLPNLNITAGAEAADARQITIQARDAANNNLAERVLVRVWIGTAEYGAPSAAGNTVAVDTGTTYEIETAHAAYKIISDASGQVQITITIAGAATRYVMAEIDGRIYSSGQLDWAA